MPDPISFLLTNDDGYDAPGLAALRRALAGLGPARVVAPSGPQSGCGHRVTTHGPIAFRREPGGPDVVEGTPADCVRLALSAIPGPVDWVIAGINAGGNLGVDLFHSGTVAAVREGVIHGLPGIAVSHYNARGRAIDWGLAATRAARVIAELLRRPVPAGAFWNVNLPHPEPGSPEPRLVYCPVDPSPLPLEYRSEGGRAEYAGVYQSRSRRPGWDVDVCLGGGIAASLVPLMASVDRFD